MYKPTQHRLQEHMRQKSQNQSQKSINVRTGRTTHSVFESEQISSTRSFISSYRSDQAEEPEKPEEVNQTQAYKVPEESMVSKTYQYKIIKLSVAIVLSMLILLPLASDETWFTQISTHEHAVDVLVNIYDNSLDWNAYQNAVDEYINLEDLDSYEPVIMMVLPDPNGQPQNTDRVELKPYVKKYYKDVLKYRPEEINEVHKYSKVNGIEFRIYYSTRKQLVVDSILGIIRTVFVCICLATVVFYITQDAKQLILNPIERIAIKVGKIALNPTEATK